MPVDRRPVAVVVRSCPETQDRVGERRRDDREDDDADDRHVPDDGVVAAGLLRRRGREPRREPRDRRRDRRRDQAEQNELENNTPAHWWGRAYNRRAAGCTPQPPP